MASLTHTHKLNVKHVLFLLTIILFASVTVDLDVVNMHDTHNSNACFLSMHAYNMLSSTNTTVMVYKICSKDASIMFYNKSIGKGINIGNCMMVNITLLDRGDYYRVTYTFYNVSGFKLIRSYRLLKQHFILVNESGVMVGGFPFMLLDNEFVDGVPLKIFGVYYLVRGGFSERMEKYDIFMKGLKEFLARMCDVESRLFLNKSILVKRITFSTGEEGFRVDIDAPILFLEAYAPVNETVDRSFRVGNVTLPPERLIVFDFSSRVLENATLVLRFLEEKMGLLMLYKAIERAGYVALMGGPGCQLALFSRPIRDFARAYYDRVSRLLIYGVYGGENAGLCGFVVCIMPADVIFYFSGFDRNRYVVKLVYTNIPLGNVPSLSVGLSMPYLLYVSGLIVAVVVLAVLLVSRLCRLGV